MSAHGSYPSPDSFPALMRLVEQAHEADTGLVLTKASIHVLRDGVHAMYGAQLTAECRVESLTPEDRATALRMAHEIAAAVTAREGVGALPVSAPAPEIAGK